MLIIRIKRTRSGPIYDVNVDANVDVNANVDEAEAVNVNEDVFALKSKKKREKSLFTVK